MVLAVKSGICTEGLMMGRLKKILLPVIFLTLFICVLYFAFHIDTVKVEGTKIYTKKEIKNSVFAGKYSYNELVLMAYNQIFGLNKLPFVEDIDINYEDRNTVVLHVYDKTISGCIKYMGQYVYFDKEGRVLESLPRYRKNVPVVTGIKFGDFSIGEKFKVDDNSLFDAIMNVSQLISHYGISVKRIHINDGDIMLYSGNVQVHLGWNKLYNDQIAALSEVLVTTNKKKLSGTIDMRNYNNGDRIVLKQN